MSTRRVFVGDEASLDVSFPAVQARLASLIRGGLLGGASAQAYRDGISSLAGVGQKGSAPGLSGLAQVHCGDLAVRGDHAQVALRWVAEGPGGGLFPVLDADITLAPAGEQSTTLRLAGVYRPLPGAAAPGPDQAAVRRVITAMIRAFLRSVTDAITHPAGAVVPQAGAADPDPPPRSPGTKAP